MEEKAVPLLAVLLRPLHALTYLVLRSPLFSLQLQLSPSRNMCAMVF